MSAVSVLRSLIAADSVQQVLNSPDLPGGFAIACLIDEEVHAYASSGKHPFSADTRVDVGCVMKNLTATLVAVAVSEARIKYDDSVAEYFRGCSGIDEALQIRHLLTQSHGLDGSKLASLPFGPDGYIDAEAIWREVGSVPAVSKPGAIFYYWGSVGYWIAAAILERLHGRTFADLLREKILRQIDCSPRNHFAAPLCPAFGGADVSARELLHLCRIHLRHMLGGNPDDPIRILGEKSSVPLGKWPPVGEGIALGWICYAGSTLGASGNSATILVSPTENAAIAISGSSVHFMRARLFGSELLDSRELCRPRLLTASERGELDLSPYVGTYRKARLSLEIRIGETGSLQASVYQAESNGGYETTPIVNKSLVPAAGNIFFPTEPEPLAIPFIRFEESTVDGCFEYAASGRHVFHRADAKV